MTSADIVIDNYCFTHQRILKHLNKLSDKELHWRLNLQTHSIAWHVWHVARWADFFQACVPGMTPELGQRLAPGVQIWEAEKLREKWDFPTALGFAESGMEMPDNVALALEFPPKDVLLDYMTRSFALADQAAKAIDDSQFQAAEQVQPMTEAIFGNSSVGHAVMVHVMHENRHLGMIESLLGLQGVPGTATV